MNPPTTVNLICRFAEWRRLRGFAPQFFMSLTRRVCLTPFLSCRGDSWMVQMSRVPIATRLSLFNCNRDNRRMPILRQTLPSAWIRHFEQPFAFHPRNPFSFLCAIHFQLYSQAHAKDRSLSMQIRRLGKGDEPDCAFLIVDEGHNEPWRWSIYLPPWRTFNPDPHEAAFFVDCQ